MTFVLAIIAAVTAVAVFASYTSMNAAMNADLDNLAYELSLKQSRLSELDRALSSMKQSTRDLSEKAERVKLSRDVQLLMDEWKPADGSPLHWSLNWILEPV